VKINIETVYQCSKENRGVYRFDASNGLTYFFDASGKEIGVYGFPDAPTIHDIPPPVDLSTCTVIQPLSGLVGVPSDIKSQYLRTEPGYITQGVYLYKCMRENETAYRLIVGGGGDAEEYYFDSRGASLGTFHDSDVQGPGYKGPTINLSKCRIIEEKGFGVKIK
jgi:hypothetical protein